MNTDEGFIPLEKDLAADQQYTVQARATQPVESYSGLGFMMLADTGSLSPPWWSESRDHYLSREWQKCPLFAGAAYNVGAKLATIPPIIEPRDPTMASHRKAAEDFSQRLIEGAEFGRGWLEFAMKWHLARWTLDNGSFGEILGAGRKDGPIVGMPSGLANLDSSRCSRTGNPEFPVVYTAENGKKYKLHHTRVIFGAQMPSTIDEMNGVGLGWFSRCLSAAQSIVDDLTFKQEKLGRRPKRGILVGKKVSVDQIISAYKMADVAADNASLTRVSMMPVVANPNASDVGIELVDLASLPDGFNWETDTNIAMYIIALTGGFPVRWMWPATVTGATKADALLQHMATAMSGTAHELGTLSLALGGSDRGMRHQAGKFLPPTLKIRFDVQDDWIDQVQAEIRNIRSQAYERNLADRAITVRVTREQMLASSEITEAQFRDMELEDGRTQEGLPVDVLFYGDNPYLQGIDPDDFEEQAVKDALKEAKRASVQKPSQQEKEEAREAVAALEWLLEPKPDPDEMLPTVPGRSVVPEAQDAPSTGNTPTRPNVGMTDQESVKALALKERLTVEEGMQAAVEEVFDRFAPEAERAAAAGREPNYDKLKALLIAALLPWLVRAFMDAIDALETEYDVDFDPAEMAAAATEWAGGYAAGEAGRLITTTKKTVGAAAAQFAAGAIARDDLGDLLDAAFNESRSNLIAITLVTIAASMAFGVYRELLAALGVQTEVYWVTAGDERVCSHICLPLDGQPQAVWELDHPHGPPAHGRCRCGLRLELVRA